MDFNIESEYYQCKVKVVTPPAPTPTVTFELTDYTSSYNEEDIAGEYQTLRELEEAGVTTAENEGKIYKVGTEESGYTYFKVTKHTSGE